MRKNPYLFIRRSRLLILSLSALLFTQIKAQVCTPVNIPYTQDFESVTIPAIPTCNTIQNAGLGNDWETEFPDDYDFLSNTLTYYYNSDEPANAWYYTEGLNLTAGVSYRLTYRYGTAGYEEKLRVSYGSSAVNTAMTHTLTNHPSVVNDVTSITQTVDFIPATTGVYYIGFNAYSDADQFVLFVDDISVNLSPSCIVPSSIAFNAVGTASASVSWTAGGAETAWDLYYGPSPLTPPVAGTIPTTTTSATNYTLSTLTAGVGYAFYVRSHCSVSDQSVWSTLHTFTTSCNPTNVPYIQNFESVTTPAIPICTSVQNVGTGNIWATNSPGDYGFTSKTLRYVYNATNAANAWFYTQGLNLTGGTSYRITYRYATSSTSSIEKMKVNYGSNPLASAMTNTISNHPSISNNTAVMSVTDFVPASTGVYYIGFNVYSDLDQYALFVDDITVDISPTCFPPTTVTIGAIAATSTNFTWTPGGSETAWDVYYGPTPLAAPNATTVPTATTSTASYSLTSLSPGTNYAFYVRSHCSPSDQSTWNGPKLFFTPCLAPNLLTTTGSTRCGVGSTTLSATGDPGANFIWYTSSTGTTTIGTGSTVTTPTISSTTNYYVTAASPQYSLSAGLMAPVATIYNDYSYGYDGLEFDATSTFTINSVDVFPTGVADDLIMQLVNGAGTVISSATIAIPAGTGTVNVTPFTVPLNFVVTPGTDYRLVSTASPDLLYNNTPGNYPIAIGNLGSITNSFFYSFGVNTSITDYTFFYNWKVSSICESPRTMVTATVTAPPALSVSTGTTVCANVVSTLSITSTLADYTGYVWSPVANLYTDAAGTIPYTGGSANTVYFKSALAGPQGYTVNANNAGTQCANVANTTMIVDIPQIKAISSPSVLCSGSTATLNASQISAGTVALGAGTSTTTGSGGFSGNSVSPYTHYYGGYKAQYILRASELTAAGLYAGNITSLAFNVTSVGATYNDFSIKMGSTAQTAMTTSFIAGLPQVYGLSNVTPVVGINTYNFSTPFNWDGSSNVAVEVTWSNNNGGGTASEVAYDATAYTAMAYARRDNFTPAAMASEMTADNTLSFRPQLFFGGQTPIAGPGTYSWQWNPGAVNSHTTPVSPTTTISTTQTYTVNVTDPVTTCTNSAVVSLTVNPIPSVTVATSSSTLCSGTSVSLTATGATTYSWMPAGGSASVAVVSPTTSTVYTVTGTNPGCSDTKTISLNVTPTPTVVASSSPTVICAGATVSLTASGATTYNWMPNSSTSGTTTATPTVSTTYTVTGTTAGCTNTRTLSVTVNTVPTLTVTSNPSSGALCTTGATATLTAAGTSTSYAWSNSANTATTSVAPTVTTVYTVTGTNSCGVRTATTSIAVATTPTISASTSSSLSCASNSVVLTANATAGVTYSWNTGATTRSITVSPASTTNYTVTATNACGTSTATIVQNVSPCTSIEEAFTGSSISIYPNPASEYVNISIPATVASANTTVEVTDALGKLVMVETLNTDVTSLKITKLEDGVYFFKVISNNQTIKVGKVVKH